MHVKIGYQISSPCLRDKGEDMEYEKITDSCGDISIENVHQSKRKTWAEKEYDVNSEHPTPEQLLVREAVRFLTPKQRKVWEFYNYDKLTQDEIANKLNIAQPVVARHIKACEKRIAKWCQSNMGAYKLLKGDLE